MSKTDKTAPELMKKLNRHSNSLVSMSGMFKDTLKSKDVAFFNSDAQITMLDVMDDYLEAMRELVEQKLEMEEDHETWRTLRSVNG